MKCGKMKENEGQKKEIIENLKKNLNGNIEKYDEAQILNNTEVFYTNILNQSFFENEKIVIINRCSEKLYEIVKNLNIKKTQAFCTQTNP